MRLTLYKVEERPVFFAFGILGMLLLASTLTYSQTTIEERSHLLVLSSSDAPGELKSEQLQGAFSQLVREWKLPEASLPSIVVFHVSKNAAKLASITHRVTLRHNQRFPGNKYADYYEVWLVGQPRIGDYVPALAAVLEDHCELKITADERRQVISRVVGSLNATVSVSDLKSPELRSP